METTRPHTALDDDGTAEALARYRGRAVRWATVGLLAVVAGAAGGTWADAAGWSWAAEAATWPVGGGLVAGLVGAGALLNSRRMQQTLSAGSWVACAAEGFAPGSGYPTVVLKDPASGALRPLVTLVVRHRFPLALPGPEGVMWWCGRPDGRGVLAQPGCTALLWARPPRTRRVADGRLRAAEQHGLPARSAPAQPQPAAPEAQEAQKDAAAGPRRHRGVFRWIAVLGVVVAGIGLAGYLASESDPEVDVVILANRPDRPCLAWWADPWTGEGHTGLFACHAENGGTYATGWVVSYGPWKGDLYNPELEGTPASDVNDALGETGLPLALVGLVGGAVRHFGRSIGRRKNRPLTGASRTPALPEGSHAASWDTPDAAHGFARVAAAARRQAPARGGPPPGDADVRRVPWWRVRALRKSSGIVPATASLTAAVVVLALVTNGVLGTDVLWPAGLPGAAGVVVYVVRAARTGIPTARALADAARSPVVHRKRYVVLYDTPDGVPVMLLFPATDDARSTPESLLPLSLPGPRSERTAGLPAPVGACEVRGGLRKHGAAVPWVEGRPLWPLGGLVPIDARDPADAAVLRQVAGPGSEPPPHAPTGPQGMR